MCGLSRASLASRAWRGLAKPMLDEFEVAYVVARLVDVVGGPPRPGPLSDSDSDDDYDGHDLDDIESRMGSVSVVERWVSPRGSVFRVGLRWSLGTARSTTTLGGLMVLVRCG